jgi:hypothetical protein
VANKEIKELVKFLIENKRLSGKDNTRDFLIWISIINHAKSNLDFQYVFVSGDKVFRENQLFVEFKNKYGVNNLIVINSIPDFFNKFGVKSLFFTEDFIKSYFTNEIISFDLVKFPLFLPGDFYIKRKQFTKYYTFKEKEQLRFVVYVELLIASLEEEYLYDDDERYLEKIDEPPEYVYNDSKVLLIYTGTLDENSKKIKNKVLSTWKLI